MFKVCFGDADIYESPQVEPAIAFALEIHRASNVNHFVTVVDSDDNVVVHFDLTMPTKK